MGTRNLTCVVSGGEYKIAQYGQWDGYPEGQGQTIVDFLLNGFTVEKMKAQLNKCRFLDSEGRDKAMTEAYNKAAPQWSNDPDHRTSEQRRWFDRYISRDIGGEILKNVFLAEDDEIVLRNELPFAADSLFCEWAYVVDLDKEVLEVYRGFNKTPLPEGERFAGMKVERERDTPYYPVKFFAEFAIQELTKETMSQVTAADQEEED